MREGTNFKGSNSGRCSFPICVYDHNTVFLLLINIKLHFTPYELYHYLAHSELQCTLILYE